MYIDLYHQINMCKINIQYYMNMNGADKSQKSDYECILLR